MKSIREMPRQVVQHVRVKPGEGAALLAEGWQLARSSRYSDLYARLVNVAIANVAMANAPVAIAPGPNMNVNAAQVQQAQAQAIPALNDVVMDELAGLLGAAKFEVGAINVANVQQANAVVQAIVQGVAAEEDALVAAFAGVGLGTKGGRKKTRKGRKANRKLKNRSKYVLKNRK